MFYILFVPLTAITWILFFQNLPRLFGPEMKRLIIPGMQSTTTTKKEYVLSAMNLLVFTGFGALLDFLKSAELTKFYFEIEYTWTSLLYLPTIYFPLFVTFIILNSHQSLLKPVKNLAWITDMNLAF